jgi:hypothetical protein
VLIGLMSAALVCGGLMWELAWPSLRTTGGRVWSRAHGRIRERGGLLGLHTSDGGEIGLLDYDPGRERRAEQRARKLLRSCVNEHEWAMYRDLGFLRVCGRTGERCAYLIYPHRPIVAYLSQTGALLNEYCVAFPDHSRPYGSERLPDSDDVLAKWMALTADERRLIADANMHLPGRQIDARRVKRDLQRLKAWEQERERASSRSSQDAGLQKIGLQSAGLQDTGLQSTDSQSTGLQSTGLRSSGQSGLAADSVRAA